jgi:hypothetical protein
MSPSQRRSHGHIRRQHAEGEPGECSDDGTRVGRDTRPEVGLRYEVREGNGEVIESETHAFLRHGAGDSGTLHLTLRVDDNTGVVLREV